ncbi:hypothetical protein, partial [Klebsiella pneumoniae]|uniref:hypothetical protein n=1 Tax=Klebsiella pneumoniae TaxID=573 RepID=UPI001D0E481A
IDVSGGKTTVILVALDSNGNAVGYSVSTYSSDSGPVVEEVFHLQPLGAGVKNSLTVNFHEYLSSSTTSIEEIADLIESITVTPANGTPFY